nr:SH3 domain-containing protein [Phytoactinopolyspora mesophila]
MYVTTSLNVRTGPATSADSLTILAAGSEVDVTGETDGDWTQILHDGAVAWVSSDYLSEEEPSEDTDDTGSDDTGSDDTDNGISSAECPTGSAVESGLTPDAIRVHRAVCARFPQIDTYHGVRSGGGAHSEGRALDVMVRGSLGDEIAEWVRANHRELGVSEVIWAQRIWTVQRSSEGWRPMEDRGSDTDNHYDHVHVTVYGDRGTT